MAAFIHLFWLCCLVLVFLRLCFTFLFFIMGFVCLDHLVTVEFCGNLTLSQHMKNALNTTGTFVETGSTIILTLVVFSWGKFSPRNFIDAVPYLPHFWFWVVFFLITVVSTATGDFRNGMFLLGLSTILEIGTLVVFCCALKFINKVTVKRWLEQMFANKMLLARFLYYLFIATMWSYLIRNVALFLYDTSIVAKKITRPSGVENFDSLLLLANCAIRGSFTQFFYAKIFRKPRLPVVCENVEHARKCDHYGSMGVTDSSGGFQPVMKWESEIEEACNKVLVSQK